MRKSGVLLPVTSLPSQYGVGCFSKSAYDFVDQLKEAGQSFWQILPLGPTGYGDSPYQSFSTFAGNPYMISLKELIKEGLLTKKECDEAPLFKEEDYIDYKLLYENRYPLLKKAFERSGHKETAEYTAFVKENNYWLKDYSFFMALKNEFGQKPWSEWEQSVRQRDEKLLEAYREKLTKEIDFHCFIQFKFYSQWNSLKAYANKNGISIIGDIPIYVSFDSADVWAEPSLFQLDDNFLPTFVAGCPPDGFSKTGQLWGNPLYCWENHQKTNYEWWKKRLRHALNLYDSLRIDHFRGFDKYYSIRYKSPDATNGEWKEAPGAELFRVAEKELDEKLIIAEDLGFITESVRKLLSDCGFFGMKVLEFAFDSRDDGATGEYLPHNYIKNCVAYTGTHDNQTLVSWLKTISEEEKKAVREYLCDEHTPEEKLHYPLIASIMKSAAFLCIVPIQDWLGLTDDARINIPSTAEKNWRWRLKKGQVDSEIIKKMYSMTRIYGRL